MRHDKLNVVAMAEETLRETQREKKNGKEKYEESVIAVSCLNAVMTVKKVKKEGAEDKNEKIKSQLSLVCLPLRFQME